MTSSIQDRPNGRIGNQLSPVFSFMLPDFGRTVAQIGLLPQGARVLAYQSVPRGHRWSDVLCGSTAPSRVGTLTPVVSPACRSKLSRQTRLHWHSLTKVVDGPSQGCSRDCLH